MKRAAWDGFSESDAWTGARACRICARYSTDGHSSDCIFAEAKRMRSVYRAAVKWDKACSSRPRNYRKRWRAMELAKLELRRAVERATRRGRR